MSSNDLLPYQQRPVGRRLRCAEPGEDVDESGGGELLGGGAVDAGQHQVEPLRKAVLIVGLLRMCGKTGKCFIRLCQFYLTFVSQIFRYVASHQK